MKHLQYSFVKILILISIAGFIPGNLFAQYYYRDIILTAQNSAVQQVYKKNKVQQVVLKSFEATGEPSEDFSCEIKPNSSFTQIRTITMSGVAGNSSLTAFYNFKGQLYKSVDSTSENVNIVEYTFDSTGKLISASNTTIGIMDKTRQTETHIWSYNSEAVPQSMLYIKGNTDTTIIKFASDDKGNIIEEEGWQKNISKGKTYYYYDSLNRLTDIVRYNQRVQKLVPDYIFEYDENNRITQMTNIQQDASDYLIWRYLYGDNALRTEERCYSKQKKLVGRVEYQYTFR
ncbi:MAG: hypothetical protein IT249_06430 [Chitinophagaceae bacterium]|nr:hypothetical protein [Chitinophagaceae bacterium]